MANVIPSGSEKGRAADQAELAEFVNVLCYTALGLKDSTLCKFRGFVLKVTRGETASRVFEKLREYVFSTTYRGRPKQAESLAFARRKAIHATDT